MKMQLAGDGWSENESCPKDAEKSVLSYIGNELAAHPIQIVDVYGRFYTIKVNVTLIPDSEPSIKLARNEGFSLGEDRCTCGHKFIDHDTEGDMCGRCDCSIFQQGDTSEKAVEWYSVTVRPLLPQHELHPLDVGLPIRWTCEATSDDHALDQFHESVPIKVLDDFAIGVERVPDWEQIAELEGWGIFDSDSRGVEIERVDEANTFPSDLHATMHVLTMAAADETGPHMAALKEWYKRSPDSYLDTMRDIWQQFPGIVPAGTVAYGREDRLTPQTCNTCDVPGCPGGHTVVEPVDVHKTSAVKAQAAVEQECEECHGTGLVPTADGEGVIDEACEYCVDGKVVPEEDERPWAQEAFDVTQADVDQMVKEVKAEQEDD